MKHDPNYAQQKHRQNKALKPKGNGIHNRKPSNYKKRIIAEKLFIHVLFLKFALQTDRLC